MENAQLTTHPGTARLLAHCRDFDRTVSGRPSPRERVEAALGADLARLLCGALSSSRRGADGARLDPRAC